MDDDPFRRMVDRMRDAFDQLQAIEHEFGAGAVPVDVEETADEVVVRADLPGVEQDRISVRADRRSIDIAADDDREVTEEGATYARRERSTRAVRRTVRLPAPVDPGSAEATYEDGVLTVTLQKAENGGARDVPVE